ncbi:hypothetical protein CEUSTIGMA_g8684.t1 [Chlamydomonas eustigma]|uniref:protein-serine/threonine phosphatase n=1 Tax=Chlamydomonas eustigma TaxID=1157962 RepID=A0A250XEC1_9CHLO|nr:hypothetical protein CEUSTIGMA_g8684.t1 [Chlamydomonas eustigma]|eukprot:GAX81252.1 hypothetical protein CEUSTIGMA_g8684.t1 [Chlamydomonas eustigma]
MRIIKTAKPAFLPTTGPLNAKDYKSRLTSSEGAQTIYFPSCNYTIRFAFVTQRGYYPDAPEKANQDSLCTHPHFGGDSEQALFGVFDGHGEYGTQCAQFAKEKIPENLLNNAQFVVSPELAYHRSMVMTNAQLHRLQEIDDSMSGTTAITVLLRGRMLYIANVGDSRCVLAERQGDRLVACDMSFDQTPFRRDECERVKRCGARVLTLDQLEGLKDPNIEFWGNEEDNDGDPPRLWAPNATYPGTAFTRSIGDSVAERIGVFAEPEVLSKQLNSTHPFMIIASDGVWEFLSSQSVVDMVSKFDDPQEACFSVVAESYRLWLQHETRTDDITMIVVQFQGMKDAAPQMALPALLGPMMDFSNRPANGFPMRYLVPPIEATQIQLELTDSAGKGYSRMLSTMSAGGGVMPHSPKLSAKSLNPSLLAGSLGMLPHGSNGMLQRFNSGGAASPTVAIALTSSPDLSTVASSSGRTEEEISFLETAVANNFLFSCLPPEHRRAIFHMFERRVMRMGEIVIRQGELGDTFYVVESGTYDVYVQHPSSMASGGSHVPMFEPELVHTYITQPGQVASFGELALLYSKERAAMVVARAEGAVWSLQRQVFRHAVQRLELSGGMGMAQLTEKELRNVVRVLRSVEVLKSLSMSQLYSLASVMTSCIYKEGEHIIRQGEEGRDFFLILTGDVACTVRKNVDDSSEVPKEVLMLTAHQYFGERALLTTAKRAANVVALQEVRVLSIGRQAFEKTFGGSLQDIQNTETKWKENLALQREVLSRKSTTVGRLLQGNFSLEDLDARGLLYSTDCSALMLMEHKESEEIFTVRVTSVADVVQLGKQALVLRAREITRGLEPCFFVPGAMKGFKDERVLAEVLMTVGLCTLDMLMSPQPFDELSAVFVAASVVLGLEHLHWSQVIYRGLSVNSIIITEGGQVQLVDFRFARKNEGRAYTLCGNPEYLAPEILQGCSHNESVDMWALGVLIFCLLSGETPFAAPGDDELRIYRKIITSPVCMPAHFSPAACDLLSRLLRKDPADRLGTGPFGMSALKSHPWFQAISWEALTEHRYAPPPGIRERIYNFEGVAYAHFDPQPCEADTAWMNAF